MPSAKKCPHTILEPQTIKQDWKPNSDRKKRKNFGQKLIIFFKKITHPPSYNKPPSLPEKKLLLNPHPTPTSQNPLLIKPCTSHNTIFGQHQAIAERQAVVERQEVEQRQEDHPEVQESQDIEKNQAVTDQHEIEPQPTRETRPGVADRNRSTRQKRVPAHLKNFVLLNKVEEECGVQRVNIMNAPELSVKPHLDNRRRRMTDRNEDCQSENDN